MIPRTIHFIWVRTDDTEITAHLFGIQTALLNTTCRIVLHTNDKRVSIPGVEIKDIEVPTHINNHAVDYKDNTTLVGENSPARNRVSHVKDILRLDVLFNEGGIYSDLDVMWLRNPWEFWDKKVVIGWQNKSYKTLCNAVMMAVPGHPAIKQYKDWCISIYPCKKYWVPANPYKLWKDNRDITMADKKKFIPISYNYKKPVTPDVMVQSICSHLHGSCLFKREGALFNILNADFARFQKREVLSDTRSLFEKSKEAPGRIHQEVKCQN